LFFKGIAAYLGKAHPAEIMIFQAKIISVEKCYRMNIEAIRLLMVAYHLSSAPYTYARKFTNR